MRITLAGHIRTDIGIKLALCHVVHIATIFNVAGSPLIYDGRPKFHTPRCNTTSEGEHTETSVLFGPAQKVLYSRTYGSVRT